MIKNMKICDCKKFIGIVLIIISTISGCVESGIEGKYYNENATGIYLELKPDKTFFIGSDMGGSSGLYEIENDEILFNFPIGTVIKGTMKGRDIVANFNIENANMWSKKK